MEIVNVKHDAEHCNFTTMSWVAFPLINHPVPVSRVRNHAAAFWRSTTPLSLFHPKAPPHSRQHFPLSIRTLRSSRNNTTWGKSVGPHTIRSRPKVGVLCLSILGGGGGLSGGGSGVSVRARGLCDISRLPIWLGEWTRSNYSCSYCLINLPVSLLHPTPSHYIFFHSLLQKEVDKSVCVCESWEWQDIWKYKHEKGQILKANGIFLRQQICMRLQ